MTKYPRDEFDQVPETSDRHGVHRARMATPKSNGLGLIILAAVLALAVGALSFFVLPLLGTGGPSTPADGATSTPAATASASPSATEQKSPSAEAEATTKPSGKATPKPTDEATRADEPTEEAGAVNKQDPVMILNGAGVSGLAGTVSQTVQNDGWSIAVVDNWGGAPLAGSVIFYNPGQEANAQALGELLGITELQENGDVSQYVTVALGPGYH